MGIVLRRPTTILEINTCVDSYSDFFDTKFLPISREASIKGLVDYSRKDKMEIALTEDGEYLGFMVSEKLIIDFSNVAVFKQQYMFTVGGYQGVKTLLALHRSMVVKAKASGCKYCLSEGSTEDSTNVLARVLEKDGWYRKHYAASLRI